jgi:predicted nucleotidyltransferase
VIRPETIDRAIDVIVAQCAPEQVFLIGSHATGTARPTSDLDLLIVQESTETKHKRDQRVEQLLAPLLIPVDINVYTPEELEEERGQINGFARTAIDLQGKLLYSRALGDFAALHGRWDAEPSAARHARLQAAPAEWQLYQAQYARVARRWPEPAWAFAAAVVRGAPGARVADLGCGERALARSVDAAVASFDHRAADDHAIAADLAALPLGDASVDLAVVSLALVGANWPDTLAEAARVVGPGGRVVVTELAAGARSLEAITAALAERGLAGATARSRGPFVDVDACKPRGVRS